MTRVENADPIESTIVRRGRQAVSYTDMVSFVAALESRPLDTLINELDDFAQLPEQKFLLAATTMRRRFRNEPPLIQIQLFDAANRAAQRVTDPSIAQRIREIVDVDTA